MSGRETRFDVVIVVSSLAGAAPGPAKLTLGDALSIETHLATFQLPYEALTSCRTDGALLLLVAGDRGDIELTSREAAGLAAALANRSCTLPELTLAMRALGTRHGGPAGEHDQFFKPLIQARAAAERARDAPSRMKAFDARALEESLQAMISGIATQRNPKSQPHRRAMEAQLLEFAEPLLAVLRRLEPLELGDEDVVAAWCSWSSSVRAVFTEADRFWQRVRSYLDAAPAVAARAPRAGGR